MDRNREDDGDNDKGAQRYSPVGWRIARRRSHPEHHGDECASIASAASNDAPVESTSGSAARPG
ncbi:uncharacterized protein RMCB_6201 [Mycolicibacterium brisbanense]|uniref:Uncharacterized protein n=1 Tax=Mycolicibacterium brisbanense TaxID=146020 RepID=A0A124E0Z9_9MYCO|nr:uncharacterized protein RMCB_6201 [Mycolicibacterium brisbanense]